MTKILTETTVQVSVRLAYRAFTNGNSLREWLCDAATVQSHVNGRVYLWWRGDQYTSGHFLALEEEKCLKFRWMMRDDPTPTEVTVEFVPSNGNTLIRLSHEIPDDPSWAGTEKSLRENWGESFENLKSILETGVDMRVANRPMLGIVPGDFTEDQAKALEVPVREGMRLDDVVNGMGAKKAGLQRDDVLVEMAGVPITRNFNSLNQAIAGKKGGDKVDITFYRGKKKKRTKMELGKRPMPKVPFDPVELARQAREVYEAELLKLEKCFDSYTDEQALKKPSPNGWSALEIVAHLIQGERFNSIYLSGLIDGFEPMYDGFGGNITAQIEATVKANPSIKMMLYTLRRTVEEILAYTELIPESFTEQRGSYYRFGFGLLQPEFHITAHIQQIKESLSAAGK